MSKKLKVSVAKYLVAGLALSALAIPCANADTSTSSYYQILSVQDTQGSVVNAPTGCFIAAIQTQAKQTDAQNNSWYPLTKIGFKCAAGKVKEVQSAKGYYQVTQLKGVNLTVPPLPATTGCFYEVTGVQWAPHHKWQLVTGVNAFCPATTANGSDSNAAQPAASTTTSTTSTTTTTPTPSQ